MRRKGTSFSRDIEWSLQAFASMRVKRFFFLRARALFENLPPLKFEHASTFKNMRTSTFTFSWHQREFCKYSEQKPNLRALQNFNGPFIISLSQISARFIDQQPKNTQTFIIRLGGGGSLVSLAVASSCASWEGFCYVLLGQG